MSLEATIREGKMSGHLLLPKTFLEALWNRIDAVRLSIDDKLPTLAIKGYRFKDNSIVRQTVVGMVSVARDGNVDDYILLQRLRGLNADKRIFTDYEVTGGLYDILIEKALVSAAEMDYQTTNNPNLH